VTPIPRLDLADNVLIRRFLAGDEAAFRSLYDKHSPRLKMILRRVLGARHQDADDLLQETWLAGCRALGQFRGDAKFSTWLTTIGVRAALGHVSRFGEQATEPLIDCEAPAGAEAASVIDLERALAALPTHQRVVVVLHDIEGFTHEEIGEQLGLATGTSKATLSRARHALRLSLNEGASHAS
jgi:RNA polymerase sigma-70 factor (ECF subfamily)